VRCRCEACAGVAGGGCAKWWLASGEELREHFSVERCQSTPS
jgi:hypothetical protein